MMNILKPAFLATALIASSYVSAAQQTAPAFVRGVADQLTERLNTDRAKYKKDPATCAPSCKKTSSLMWISMALQRA